MPNTQAHTHTHTHTPLSKAELVIWEGLQVPKSEWIADKNKLIRDDKERHSNIEYVFL